MSFLSEGHSLVRDKQIITEVRFNQAMLEGRTRCKGGHIWGDLFNLGNSKGYQGKLPEGSGA